MFGKKKLPILTETFCSKLDLIRVIAEVLTGFESRIKRFDFNTGRGQIYVCEEARDFHFDRIDDERFNFAFIATLPKNPAGHHEAYSWQIVHLDEPGTVRIGAQFERDAHKKNGHIMWWVGSSATNRWEEPLFAKDLEYSARVHGMSVKDYIETHPA